MRPSLPYVAAVLLVALSPAYAANPPKADAGRMAMHKSDDAMKGDVSRAAQGDDTTKVIILDQGNLEALPNPYANPEPRMISDVWAMRT